MLLMRLLLGATDSEPDNADADRNRDATDDAGTTQLILLRMRSLTTTPTLMREYKSKTVV